MNHYCNTTKRYRLLCMQLNSLGSTCLPAAATLHLLELKLELISSNQHHVRSIYMSATRAYASCRARASVIPLHHVLASYPGPSQKKAWYTLFAHARNYPQVFMGVRITPYLTVDYICGLFVNVRFIAWVWLYG